MARHTALPIALILLIAVGIWVAANPLNHDVSWYLVATRRWLDGATLYRDIVEINPPLAFYEVAAALLVPLSLPDKLAYIAIITMLAAVSLLWTRRIADHADAGIAPVIASAAALILLPINDFGQREHALLIFALPYIWLIALGQRGSRAEEVGVGLFAFFGFALKPYFLAIPVLTTIAQVMAKRSLRPIYAPANLVIGFACIIYGIAAWIMHPAYFAEIVPVARITYFAYGMADQAVLVSPVLLAALPIGIIGLGRGATTRILAAGLAGAIIAYIIQFKGWQYHQMPIKLTGILLAAWLIAHAAPRRLADPGVLAALLFLGVTASGLRGPYRGGEAFALLAPHIAGSRSAMILGSNVWLAYPVTQELGVRHTSRYPALWTLPGATIVARGEDNRAARARAILADGRRAIVDDFVAGKPDVLIIDERRKKPYFDKPFDYIAFLSNDPRFIRAMASYRPKARAGQFMVWRRGS